MTESKREWIARESYLAYAKGDHDFFDRHLGDGFTFSSPPDPMLDRQGWEERCWPGSGRGQELDFVRVVELGDEVLVTYESRRTDGSGGRNTEIMAFNDDDQIIRTEVYFGWELDR